MLSKDSIKPKQALGCKDFAFGVQSFAFGVLVVRGFGFGVLRFEVLGCGLSFEGYRFWVSRSGLGVFVVRGRRGYGFRGSCFPVRSFEFSVEGFGFGVLGSGFRVGLRGSRFEAFGVSRSKVSASGLLVRGSRFMVAGVGV